MCSNMRCGRWHLQITRPCTTTSKWSNQKVAAITTRFILCIWHPLLHKPISSFNSSAHPVCMRLWLCRIQHKSGVMRRGGVVKDSMPVHIDGTFFCLQAQFQWPKSRAAPAATTPLIMRIYTYTFQEVAGIVFVFSMWPLSPTTQSVLKMTTTIMRSAVSIHPSKTAGSCCPPISWVLLTFKLPSGLTNPRHLK